MSSNYVKVYGRSDDLVCIDIDNSDSSFHKEYSVYSNREKELEIHIYGEHVCTLFFNRDDSVWDMIVETPYSKEVLDFNIIELEESEKNSRVLELSYRKEVDKQDVQLKILRR
jgi:hypothetical protein